MEAAGLLGILGWCSIYDVKKKTVQRGVLLLAAIVGVWLHLCYGRITVWDMLGGMAVGGAMWLFAHLSGEKIGKGDAFLVMVCGIFLGLWKTVILLWISLMIASLAGVIMLLLGKSRNYQMPFVPFLLLGYIFYLFLRGGSLG